MVSGIVVGGGTVSPHHKYVAVTLLTNETLTFAAEVSPHGGPTRALPPSMGSPGWGPTGPTPQGPAHSTIPHPCHVPPVCPPDPLPVASLDLLVHWTSTC
ncbi:hypothetical protein E2C01_038777 [Portunus trituberculatus]|uniref:Uncharacterized protein n=1 Tax=Portunus trituberculatus TaxID=210409 RepID=A0A5B7FF14_PORTR|nr:hypothetical protein [Portunus trituberculatus]